MTDPLVSLQQPLVDLGLRFSRLSRKFRHLRGRFRFDALQFGLLGFEVLSALRHQGLGLLDLRLFDLDSGSILFQTLFGQLDFQLLILDLLGNGIELAVVPDVVLLLLVIADEYLGLIHLALTLLGESIELLDFGIDILDTRLQTGQFVVEILHLERQLTLHLVDRIDLAVDLLEIVEGQDFLLHRIINFSCLFLCCHIVFLLFRRNYVTDRIT